MKLTKHEKLNKVLDKGLLKHRPLASQVELFKIELAKFYKKIDADESEEFNKNLIIPFLTNALYHDDYFINTKNRTDLVIHNGASNKTSVGVIVEVKSPKNKAEWFTADKPNSKAIQELVLYYLRERIEEKNIDVKYLVATNINEWYIFEASDFKDLFFDNKDLVKKYENWRDGKTDGKETSVFYNDIIKPEIDKIDALPCTYFNINSFKDSLNNPTEADNKRLITLFKILSPNHLLKVSFANDSNELNDKFYKELLHIIGLEEAKEGGKNIIRRKAQNRNAASLIEQAIEQLQTEDLRNVPDQKTYGETYEEQYFNIALELCITWVNRILFLKLLEGQLLNYHKGNQQYRFLNSQTVPTFTELYTLFHRVLAVDVPNRNAQIQEKYSLVPYLNSSLFEISDLESVTIKINSIDSTQVLDYIGTTILKEHKKKNQQLPTIDYLFLFLDAYDFASEDTGDLRDDNRTLINASVLGKVFEKINGYKDGSIYTPGFITMYMSRQSIRLAVQQKFNDAYGWACTSFDELIEKVEYQKPEERSRANALINDLKICDPAVGSGHFLVSALNEVIAIKSELNILQDANGTRLKAYTIEVINDELSVFDEDGEPFTYHPNNPKSLLVQQTLFTEKQTIIENCLFGVDINPNSVKICRLRLWIELLKNAYYKADGYLETLPNIDINIKCGNSLISRFALDADLGKALKSIKYDVNAYRGFVNEYKNCKDRETKRGLQDIIDRIKADFRTEIAKTDPLVLKLNKASGELYNLVSQHKIFDDDAKTKKLNKQKQQKLEADINRLSTEVEDIKSNAIYKNAFEWRFEFPEVLNNEGDFEGFDLVIANPPYIRQEELGRFKNYLQNDYQVYTYGADIFSYFYELSIKILTDGGILSFINNTFDKTTAGKVLRDFTVENLSFKKYIDFTEVVVFDEATTYPIILIAEKSSNEGNFDYLKFSKDSFTNKQLIYDETKYVQIDQKALNSSSWNFLNRAENRLKTKIESNPSLRYIYGKCYYGVKTSLNEAFITNGEFQNSSVIKPVYEGKDLKKWQVKPPTKKIIVFESKSTKRTFGNLDEVGAFNQMTIEHPQIMKHLSKYATAAKMRFDKGEFWWELRNCAYYNLFEKPKIVFPNLQNTNKFALDLSGSYLNAPAVFLPTDDKYLLAVLNSKVVWHFLKSICVIRSGGYIEVKPQYFEQIPIPESSQKEKDCIIEIVNQIMEEKEKNKVTNDLEHQINQLVYQLYNLSPEDIAIIEKETATAK